MTFLVANGLKAEALSRQRLRKVEQGAADLPPALLHAIANALAAGGVAEDDVASLRTTTATTPEIEPPPSSTPALRRRQWTAVAGQIPESRWWTNLGALVSRLGGTAPIHQYQRLLARHGIDPRAQLDEVSRRLALAPTGAGCQAGDRVIVEESDPPDLRVRLERGALFVFRVTLRNAGPVTWRDRFLYRLGPPVTSSLPFALTLMPVPDTAPGESCEMLIPGRAQWFLNLAVISFVMVSADCTPCLPGQLQCFVDTRKTDQYDHTLQLPAGYRPG